MRILNLNFIYGALMNPHIEIVKPTILRARQACQYLGIALSTFWQYVREGKLPQGIKYTPRCTVFRIEDLDRFIENASQKSNTATERTFTSKRGRPRKCQDK
jgi:predicted DNA-binding transcriptional regulator AlpA